MRTLSTSRRARALQTPATLMVASLLVFAPSALAGKPEVTAKSRSGRSLVVRLAGNPECLDMAIAGNGYDYYATYPVLDTLLSANDNGKPVPYLAQSYTVRNSGKTLQFTLRHDVRFSNGRRLTASDVKADFDRILDPATKSPIALSYLEPVKSITTSGRYTVTLHLSEPSRPLLGNLTSDYLGIWDPTSVTPAGGDTCKGLVGSGPFTITRVGPSYTTIQEARNPLHTFGPSWAHNRGPAYLSTLTFTPITSDTTAVSELLSGQLNLTDVAGDQLNRVTGNKDVVLHRLLQPEEAFLLFNSGKAPFTSVAVRRAVAEAINRASLVAAALNGLGEPATSILPPTVWGYDPASARNLPSLNLQAARAAIAAAHATGPYTLVTPASQGRSTAAELIQAELAQVGMQINIVTKPVPDWLAALGKGDFHLSLVIYGTTDPDELYLLFHSSQTGGLNFTNMVDSTLDRLLLAGRTTLNWTKAKEDYVQAQKRIATQMYADPLWVPILIEGVNRRVQGWHVTKAFGIQYQDLWLK